MCVCSALPLPSLRVLVLSRTTANLRRHAVPADGGKTGTLVKPRGPIAEEKVTGCDSVVTLCSPLFNSPLSC